MNDDPIPLLRSKETENLLWLLGRALEGMIKRPTKQTLQNAQEACKAWVEWRERNK